MRCTTNHGSMIRDLVRELTFSWFNIHAEVVDGETQADRILWCVRELSVRDESHLAHLASYHWDELLTALPQDLRFGFREFAKDLLWSPEGFQGGIPRGPWVIS